MEKQVYALIEKLELPHVCNVNADTIQKLKVLTAKQRIILKLKDVLAKTLPRYVVLDPKHHWDDDELIKLATDLYENHNFRPACDECLRLDKSGQ